MRAAKTSRIARQNVRRDLAQACDRADIEPCTPNDLRRTCATWLRQAGAAPDLIAPVMGHADTRMVERVYGRLPVDDLERRLAAAIGQTDCSAGATLGAASNGPRSAETNCSAGATADCSAGATDSSKSAVFPVSPRPRPS